MVYNSRMAEQINPIINQAELLIQEGKNREARLLLVGFLKGSPTSGSAWWTLSQAVEEENQVIDCLERTLRYDPGHELALARLAQIKNPPLPYSEPSFEETPLEAAPSPSIGDVPHETASVSAGWEASVKAAQAPTAWDTPLEAESFPAVGQAPTPTEAAAPTEGPLRELLFSTDDATPQLENEFDLFAPGAFEEQNTQPAEVLNPSEAARPWVEQLVQSLNSAGEPEAPVQETENAPAWAFPDEPSSPPESTFAEEKFTKNRMSTVEVILLIILVLLILAVGGFFALSLLGII
jgi:hypothetical protein